MNQWSAVEGKKEKGVFVIISGYGTVSIDSAARTYIIAG